MDERVLETLRDAQRFGFFGARPIEAAAEHSLAFVTAIGPLDPGSRVVDLGSGGGLPGLVIADAYPSISLTLIDRRQKRTDFLRRAVSRLGWDHVTVLEDDVGELARQVATGTTPLFDVVTARGFGPPVVTLRLAAQLTESRIVVSEPPSGDRWDPELLVHLGLDRRRVGAVSVFTPSA